MNENTNNNVSINGNSNIVIKDTNGSNISINLFDFERLKEIIEKYNKEKQSTTDENRKKEITTILSSIEKLIEPISIGLSKSLKIINKNTKLIKILQISSIFLFLLILVTGYLFFTSEWFLIKYSYEKYLSTYCQDSTGHYCDSVASLQFKEIRDEESEYREFLRKYAPYKFKICKIAQDSLTNKEFMECKKINKLENYNIYISKHDSTNQKFTECWDSIICLEYKNISSNTKSCTDFINKCKSKFKGSENIIAKYISKAESIAAKEDVKIIGTWEQIDGNLKGRSFRFIDSNKLNIIYPGQSPIPYDYSINSETILISNNTIIYKILDFQTITLKLEYLGDQFILIRK